MADSEGKVSNMVVAAAIAGFVSGIPSAVVSSYVAIKLLENNMGVLSSEVSEIKLNEKETQKQIEEVNIKLARISAIQDVQQGPPPRKP